MGQSINHRPEGFNLGELQMSHTGGGFTLLQILTLQTSGV